MQSPLVDPKRIILISSSLPFKTKFKNATGLMEPIREEGIDYALIWVLPHQSKKEKFATIIHESLHVAYPSLTEQEILDGEIIVTETLWKAGYRKV